LLLEEDGEQLVLLLHPQSSPAALGEVLRKYPHSRLQTLPAPALVQRIS